MNMKYFKYIFPLVLLLSACDQHKGPETDSIAQYDSIYTIADIQWHQQYYPLLDRQVFSIDLLTEGLSFDSTYHIEGSGQNLYFSDIFLPLTDTLLQDGVYRMDSTANEFTFLPYMYFEGNITGCYMLDIQDSQMRRIIGFTSGEFEITSLGDDMRMEISLYMADSTSYHAIYQGPAIYR